MPGISSKSLARDIFVKELAKARDETGFHLLGYVVMPVAVDLEE
jgi:hypothetical protein